MAKNEKKEPTAEEKEAAIGKARIYKVKRQKEYAAEHRRKYDWEWLVRTLYVRGYHFARYNRGTNSVVFSSRTGVRIPINLVGAHLRGVRNQVTSFQPKWEVLPKVTTESAFENARFSGKTLDYIYEKAQVKRKIKEAITDALLYSIGVWKFGTDDKKNVTIDSVDPFDLYVDPNIKSANINDPDFGAEYIILSHQVPLDAIKSNKEYKNTEQLQADNLIASAEYKRFLLQAIKNQQQSQTDNNPTKILNEAWIRERQEDGSLKIRFLVYVDDMEDPLLDEVLDETDYPFEILQGDIYQRELYGESWVKHLIPINRAIDALESHIFEYNHFFARGRFIMDKNSGARVIVNQHGQIIEKNRGAQIQAITVPPLPPSPQEQISSMRKYLEDISGVHDVSLGRLPGTIRSGVAIAELKQADATNQGDLVDNLEDFLSRAGKRILNLVAENWTSTQLISVTGLGGKPEYFMAVGEKGTMKKKGKKFTFGEMDLPIAIIGADNEVRVQVGSWLAYTKEARQEKLKELFRLGAIDQKTYLEFSEFADIDGIVKRTQEEKIMQMRAGQPSQAVGRQYGMEMSDEELALAENEMMLEGVDQPVHPEDDHQVHVLVHKEHSKNDIVRAHINEHINQMNWMARANTQPNPTGEEALPPEMGGAPETFMMNPPVGPGAPPFNPSQPVIKPPDLGF